jgi:hypothetical protein
MSKKPRTPDLRLAGLEWLSWGMTYPHYWQHRMPPKGSKQPSTDEHADGGVAPAADYRQARVGKSGAVSRRRSLTYQIDATD